MSYHQANEHAQALIHAAENGDYDQALGISSEHRDLLAKAADPAQRLTVADIERLSGYGEAQAISDAYDADRIDLTQTTTTNGDDQ